MSLGIDPPPPIDSSRTVIAPPIPRHPWRRFVARKLDYVFFAIVIAVSFGLPRSRDGGISFLADLVTILCWIPIEAGFLAFAGWTPGKWLLGVTVRTAPGTLLPFAAALRRTFWATAAGQALGLRFFGLICNYHAWSNLNGMGFTIWDPPEEIQVHHRGIRWAALCAALFAGAVVLIAAEAVRPAALQPK